MTCSLQIFTEISPHLLWPPGSDPTDFDGREERGHCEDSSSHCAQRNLRNVGCRKSTASEKHTGRERHEGENDTKVPLKRTTGSDILSRKLTCRGVGWPRQWQGGGCNHIRTPSRLHLLTINRPREQAKIWRPSQSSRIMPCSIDELTVSLGLGGGSPTTTAAWREDNFTHILSDKSTEH